MRKRWNIVSQAASFLSQCYINNSIPYQQSHSNFNKIVYVLYLSNILASGEPITKTPYWKATYSISYLPQSWVVIQVSQSVYYYPFIIRDVTYGISIFNTKVNSDPRQPLRTFKCLVMIYLQVNWGVKWGQSVFSETWYIGV